MVLFAVAITSDYYKPDVVLFQIVLAYTSMKTFITD